MLSSFIFFRDGLSIQICLCPCLQGDHSPLGKSEKEIKTQGICHDIGMLRHSQAERDSGPQFSVKKSFS